MRLYKTMAYIAVDLDTGERIVYDNADEAGRMLHVDFDITKTSSRTPNTGKVQIYNLGESDRRLISKSATKLTLYLGYDGQAELISVADIDSVNSLQVEVDWVTEFTLGEGQSALQSQQNRTYKEGSDAKLIISQIASDAGLVVNNTINTVKGLISGGITLEGSTQSALGDMSSELGLDFSVQNDELFIAGSDGVSDGEAVVVAPDTGLIGYPEITDKGVNLKVQIQSGIFPGKVIKLETTGFIIDSGQSQKKTESREDSGFYVCQQVRFQGNNYGGDFAAVVEAREL